MNAEFWWNKVGAYNEALFPMQILLIFVALALTYLLFSKPSARNNNLMKGYLSFLCAWNGILFFLIYGRELPGKILGAPLFILAAALFTWDIKSGKTQFRLPEATWQKYLTGLLMLSAFMYPLVGAALGHVYPESCTFGVMPCPTTVFALALLSAALPEADKKVYVVLLVWALPALGKCLGALDLYEDCILFWTGVYSLMILIKTWKKERRTKEPQQREFLDTSGIGKVELEEERMSAIKVNGLHKCYGDFEVLKGIDLEIERGEFYVLMGQNGSGKTTLISIITCTSLPSGGSVKVHGFNVVDEAEEVKKLIGYVPQENFSCPKLTGQENLVFFARLFGLSRWEAEEVAEELLGKVGLARDAKKRVSKYSGGMRKRLEVATALMPGIEVLFLDEPTTGLDPSARKNFLGMLKDVNDDGTTVFLVTHIGEDAEAAARVGFIDEGRIVVEDEPERLRIISGLRNVLEMETSIKSEGVVNVLKPFSDDAKILETDGGYKIYCEKPEESTPRIVRFLDEIGCRVTRIETTAPSLEDVFFKLTQKSLRG